MLDAYHLAVAARIRAVAKRKGVSLNQLADLSGVSRSQLARILRGAQSPKLTTLRAFAATLDVTVRELLPTG